MLRTILYCNQCKKLRYHYEIKLEVFQCADCKTEKIIKSTPMLIGKK